MTGSFTQTAEKLKFNVYGYKKTTKLALGTATQSKTFLKLLFEALCI